MSLCAAPASAEQMTHERFAAVMDNVFGPGAWRMTGGYRTPQRENELRAQGAMTVRPGGVSRHSLGRPGAPGAYDVVVNGMSPYEAANRLRAAGAPFARYQPKGAHGTQGPHLHLEPHGFGQAPVFHLASASASKPQVADEGRARSVTIAMPAPSPRSMAAARGELARFRADAAAGDPEAQLELARALALGYVAPRNFAEAHAWLVAVLENTLAEPDTRAAAADGLAMVTPLLEAEKAQRSAQYATLSADR